MKKNISLSIYNEPYWDKSLIYTQNILPLIKLKERYPENYDVNIISFTSVLDLFVHYKKIKNAKRKLQEIGINVTNYPVICVKSRYLIFHYYLFPLLLVNVFPFIIYLSIFDLLVHKDKYYHMRSYPMAAIFNYLYFGQSKLIFDPRTDFISELDNLGIWKSDAYSKKMWLNIEKKMLNKSKSTIFISEAMMSDILDRTGYKYNEDKHIILYNLIDIDNFRQSWLFHQNFTSDKFVFLYTGSLGYWNDLRVYLDFYFEIVKYKQDSEFIIVTNSSRKMIEGILNDTKYSNILNHIAIFYSPKYEELSFLYNYSNIGLQLMKKNDSRVGVKFLEYLASGIMPLTNLNVRGAVELCEKYSIGYVLDIHKRVNVETVAGIEQALSLFAENLSSSDITDIFDLNKSYKKFQKIYS